MECQKLFLFVSLHTSYLSSLFLFLRFQLVIFSLSITSTVFQLPEGKMLSFFGLVPIGSALDIPNGILGMMFYIYVFIRFNVVSSSKLLVLFDRRVNAVICSLALASSIFLARKLYIIKEICVVCLTTHVINTTMFHRAIKQMTKKQMNKVKVT